MPHHDNDVESPVSKGSWLNRKLPTQLAVLIILLECTVVLALVSHVITVTVPPEPMWTMTIGGPIVSAPSDVRQQATEKQRVADAAAHAAKTEPFDPFAGIVEGVACGLPVEELPQDNHDDASRPDGNDQGINVIIDGQVVSNNYDDQQNYSGQDSLLKHDPNMPILIMHGATIDGSPPALLDDSGTDSPKVMSLKEFTAYYGRVGDFGGTVLPAESGAW